MESTSMAVSYCVTALLHETLLHKISNIMRKEHYLDRLKQHLKT